MRGTISYRVVREELSDNVVFEQRPFGEEMDREDMGDSDEEHSKQRVWAVQRW